jgi:hypothetical protein
MECSNTASADPTISGPPTIETHLANINATMTFIKYMGSIIAGLVGLLIGSVIYIFKSTIANVRGSIHHVEKNLKEDIDKNEAEIKDIKRNFMSIKSHEMICDK